MKTWIYASTQVLHTHNWNGLVVHLQTHRRSLQEKTWRPSRLPTTLLAKALRVMSWDRQRFC